MDEILDDQKVQLGGDGVGNVPSTWCWSSFSKDWLVSSLASLHVIVSTRCLLIVTGGI